MTVVIVATAIPAPEYRDEVIAAFATAIENVHASEDDGLAALGAALRGKLTGPLDVQILAPHPAGSAGKGAL